MNHGTIAPQGFGDSLNRLKNAQKSNTGAPLYSVLVNRPMGRVFAAAAHQVGLTPNGVTDISPASPSPASPCSSC